MRNCILILFLSRTYSDVGFTAGPYLNMILGPNGTGKSALVCGIILGLGGEPGTTGRAGQIGDYIRFGCEFALITIELFNDKGSNWIITRRITSTVNHKGKQEFHSNFTLNGKELLKRQITEFIRSLNIHVDNLCQFLPQERVIEFVKMNQQDLLLNTERAAGDQQMVDDHQEVIQLSKEIRSLVRDKETLCQDIDIESEEQKRVQDELRAIEERDNLKREKCWLEKKIPWIRYEQKRVEYVEAKKNFEEKEQQIKNGKLSIEPLKKELLKSRDDMAKFDKQKRTKIDRLRQLAQSIEPIKRQLEKSNEKAFQVQHDYESKIEREIKRQNDLDHLNNQLTRYKEELNNMPEVDVDNEIERVTHEINHLYKQINQLAVKRDQNKDATANLYNQKQNEVVKREQISNNFKLKLDKLYEMNANAKRAYDWLKNNKDRFTDTIYPPMITQINVKQKDWAKYVENSIANHDLVAFMCKNPDDVKSLSRMVWDELRIRINIVLAPQQTPDDFPTDDIDQLKKYGFFIWVKDMFDAPDPIMAYLCKQYWLHRIPVGDCKVDDNLERISKMKLTRVYSKDQIHSMKRSRFNPEKVMTTSDQIPQSRILHLIVDQNELKRIHASIQRIDGELLSHKKELEKLDQTENEMKQQIEDLKQQKAKLLQKKNARKELEIKIQQRQDEIDRIQTETIDVMKLKEKVTNLIKKNMKEQNDLLEQLVDSIEKCEKMEKEKLVLSQQESLLKKKLSFHERQYNEAQEKFKTLSQGMNLLKEQLEALKNDAKRQREMAKQVYDYDSSNQTDKNHFAQLPNSIEEIDAKLNVIELRLKNVGEVDETIKDDYRKRGKQIEANKKKLAAMMKDLNDKKAKLETIKERWIASLENLIQRINTSFTRFMSKLSYAGEIELYRGKSEVSSFVGP